MLGLSLQHHHVDINGLSFRRLEYPGTFEGGEKCPPVWESAKILDVLRPSFYWFIHRCLLKSWLTWLLNTMTGSTHSHDNGSPQVLALLPLAAHRDFTIFTLTLPSSVPHEISPLWTNQPSTEILNPLALFLSYLPHWARWLLSPYRLVGLQLSFFLIQYGHSISLIFLFYSSGTSILILKSTCFYQSYCFWCGLQEHILECRKTKHQFFCSLKFLL